MTPQEWVADMRKIFKLRVTMSCSTAGVIKGKPLPTGFVAHPSPTYKNTGKK